MNSFHPRYLVHGHIHLMERWAPRETRFGETVVVNAYDHCIIELETDPR